jgi:hypothetical protein
MGFQMLELDKNVLLDRGCQASICIGHMAVVFANDTRRRQDNTWPQRARFFGTEGSARFAAELAGRMAQFAFGPLDP